MPRRVKKSPIKKSPTEMRAYWIKLHGEMFDEPRMTAEEFADEMMGVIDGKKFMADVTDIVSDRQMTRSQAGIAQHRSRV